MHNPSYIALSRQTALMRQMDIVANNIANASTPGFRGEQVLFAEHLQQVPGVDMSYVEDLAVIRDTRPGELQRTGNDLDLAIEGAGYFVAQTPAGDRYTRNGHLQLDADRRIVTSQGYPILGDNNQELQLPADTVDVAITPDGIVLADGEEVGRIGLVTFDNDQALKKTMGGLYATDQEPLPAAEARLLQGMMEGSNVRPVIEMTRMMELHRAFEGVQNMINGEHERMLRAIRELPRIQTA